MHWMAASTSRRAGLAGSMAAGGSARVAVPANVPTLAHLSRKPSMSQARSFTRFMLRKGSMVSRPSGATRFTCVRQVQRGVPLMVIAQEPQTPTRQEKR